MEAHRRRSVILSWLKQNAELDVDVVARHFGVSANTIRKDLNAMAAAGQLQRVHGGAILLEDVAEPERETSEIAARRTANMTEKLRIARWAAELVNDGDSICLDASSTVYQVADFLEGRRNLTVITNGIDAGRKLARNATNKVLLLGGLLRPDGVPVTGLLSEQFLSDLRIKTAFVSSAGFTLEGGLSEPDVLEAELKSKMVAAADSVIALVDSSKFGKAELAPFCPTGRISHIFTDDELDASWLDRVQAVRVPLTLCGQNATSTFRPHERGKRQYRIGFANIGEEDAFAIEVRRGVERAASVSGDIDLVLGDNQFNNTAALKVADNMVRQKVDLAIEFHFDSRFGDAIMARFRQADIPVIAVDIPMVGAIYFGIDNYRSGYLAGEALGCWIKAHWDGEVDYVIVHESMSGGDTPYGRTLGQLDGLQDVIGLQSEAKVIHLDAGAVGELSQERTESTLLSLPDAHRIAVLCYYDESALGAIAGARKLGRERDIAVAGQGAYRRTREELRQPGSPLICSTAYRPEKYGEQLLSLAGKVLHHEPVAPAVYTESLLLTADNVNECYPEG